MPRYDHTTTRLARKHLAYDHATGLLHWRETVQWGTRRRAGEVAGCKVRRGYIRVAVNGRSIGAHKIAWLLMTGDWPPDGYEVDHKDGDPSNNRWRNLRLATTVQNGYNRKVGKNSPFGVKGVCREGNRYVAYISVDGRQRKLGWFGTLEEAVRCRREAEKRYHGKFRRR